MTLWNPLNVLSGQQRPAGDEPSASFDPSRTGDPLGPGAGRPAIGIGDSRVGGAAGPGDPRRHPIGFAPPEEQPAGTRYRTEISFKRHHELPRASATLDGTSDSQEPSPPISGPVAAESAIPEDAASEAMVELDERQRSFGEAPVAEDPIPFYKRELSFRRKREIPAEAAVVAAVGAGAADGHEEPVEDVAEVVAQADDHEEPVDAVEERDAPDAVEVVVAEEQVSNDAPVTEDAIPFYKRELSLRRKPAAPAEAVVAAAVVAGEEEPVEGVAEVVVRAADDGEPVEAVVEQDAPASPEVVAAVETPEELVSEPAADVSPASAVEEDRDHEAVAEHDAAVGVAAAELSVVAAAERDVDEAAVDEEQDSGRVVANAEQSVEDVGETAEGSQAVADAEPLPVAVAEETAEETPEADASTGPDEAPAEEAPAPVGRFGSRKNRSTEKKAGRRKSGHGGQGRKVVGLKIGASQIAASVVSETEAGYELLGLARRQLAAGIVVDGEVRDENALAIAVKALFDEEKLPKTDVRIGLSSNRIGVRTIDIVGSDDAARFDNAVRFKAHEVLPVALHESVLDYRVIEERPGEGGEHLRRVLLVVAPRDQVEPYQRMADRAGIKLTGIDLEALGLLRAFVEPKSAAAPKVDDTATVVVAIGHESSTLLVAGGGTCEFTRVFDWGGGALEEAIASTLDVRPAEAATILRHLSLSGPGRQYEPLDEVMRAQATETVRARLTPFARELVNSLQFYQTQAESLGIGGIVITGGASHLEGLSDALHQMIGVDVSVGDPFGRVIRTGDLDPAIEALSGSMAVSIGLAIDDGSMRSVNLLPKDAIERKTTRSTALAIGAPIAAVVPLAALSFLFFGAHAKVGDRQAELDAVQAEIAALPAPQKTIIDAGLVGDEAARATAVASVLGGRLAWDGVFRDLARVLPENVSLTHLAITKPEVTNLADGTTAAAPLPGQAPSAPTAVSIEGFTDSQPDVARLLARLATLPSLQRVTLVSSQSQTTDEKFVVQFTIVADLNETGGAS